MANKMLRCALNNLICGRVETLFRLQRLFVPAQLPFVRGMSGTPPPMGINKNKELYRRDGVRITHDPYAPGMREKYGAPGDILCFLSYFHSLYILACCVIV